MDTNMDTNMETEIINLSNIPGFVLLIKSNEKATNILKLNKVECKTENKQKYKVVRYDKTILDSSLFSSFGLCRSIVLNMNDKVVCFSPPKSILSESFIKAYPLKTEEIQAMEFVEGTMINVFWDDSIGVAGGWQIATRNTVGATSAFYKNPVSKETLTFRDMFLEAVKLNNLNIESLNKSNCYSFVLQHPKNRIVVPFKTPQLYLVACYTINHLDDYDITVKSHSITDIMKYDWSMTTIKFPKIYDWSDYVELINNYASMNTSYDILGVILYNVRTGERAKIRNPVYEEVRSLRGNQPKLQYQYLSLRQSGKVGDFLKYYPENKKDFSQFRDQIHAFTQTLYENYVSCYIKKEKALKYFSDQYRTHMFKIHEIYINDLKECKRFVTNTVVIKYVNELHPNLLMYCLNFHMRKRVVDFIKSESELSDLA